jgi:predicted ArsR family transcriptional regulator
MGTFVEADADLPLVRLCRKTDPPTSHAAAIRAPVRGHAARVLAVLRLGPAGQSEIGARCGLSSHQVNKRLPELHAAGLVELTGRQVQGLTGCMEREWKVTAASR